MRRLERDELQSGATTLAEAFWDDPLMQIVAPDERRRTTVGPWFFELSLKYALRYGGEVSCNEDATATAIWFPPGKTDISSARMMRVGFAALPFKAGINGARRFFSALSATEKFHKAVEGPHWYLLAVGAQPEQQGKGARQRPG